MKRFILAVMFVVSMGSVTAFAAGTTRSEYTPPVPGDQNYVTPTDPTQTPYSNRATSTTEGIAAPGNQDTFAYPQGQCWVVPNRDNPTGSAIFVPYKHQAEWDAFKANTPFGQPRQCTSGWTATAWSTCSASCNGTMTRTVQCVGEDGKVVPDAQCAGARPVETASCGNTCAPPPPASIESNYGEQCVNKYKTRTAAGTQVANGCNIYAVFNYTGGDQYFTVPPQCAGAIGVRAWGAGGGGGRLYTPPPNQYNPNPQAYTAPGSAGAFSEGVIEVQAGEVLRVQVGQGGCYANTCSSIYGGGGQGGGPNGGDGGGASGVYKMDGTPLIVAGGGGGGSMYYGMTAKPGKVVNYVGLPITDPYNSYYNGAQAADGTDTYAGLPGWSGWLDLYHTRNSPPYSMKAYPSGNSGGFGWGGNGDFFTSLPNVSGGPTYGSGHNTATEFTGGGGGGGGLYGGGGGGLNFQLQCDANIQNCIFKGQESGGGGGGSSLIPALGYGENGNRGPEGGYNAVYGAYTIHQDACTNTLYPGAPYPSRGWSYPIGVGGGDTLEVSGGMVTATHRRTDGGPGRVILVGKSGALN